MPSSTWRMVALCGWAGRYLYDVAAYDARWRLAIIASVHPFIAALNPTRRCHPIQMYLGKYLPTSYLPLMVQSTSVWREVA